MGECFGLFHFGSEFLIWPCTKVMHQLLAILSHLERRITPSEEQEEKAGHFVREIKSTQFCDTAPL